MTTSVYIAKNVYGGDGLGRLGDGRVVFVPGAFEGEQVRAEIVQEKKGFCKARLVEVEDGVEGRRSTEQGAGEGIVPGMVYAPVTPAFECALKAKQLQEFFDRARIRVDAIKQLKTEKILNYRNKVTYHFNERALGYHIPETNTIVDVAVDPLACEAINAELPKIRAQVKTLLTVGAPAVRKSIAAKESLVIRWSALSGVKWWFSGEAKPTDTMKEKTLGRVFEVPPDGFYQVNPEAGERLVEAVVNEYRREQEVAPNVLDLYCGVGVFGLSCNAPKLIGVESGRAAIDFARRNGSGSFYCEEVGRNRKRIGIGSQTTVIVDPPRGGLEKGVSEWLRDSRAPRLFYVSCDPATLMRDLRVITQTYDVVQVSWVNMFPRTARFETFVSLRKKA